MLRSTTGRSYGGRAGRDIPQSGEERWAAPRIALFREAWIADSLEEAQEVWGPHVLAVHRLYYNVGAYRRQFEPWVDDVRDRAKFTWDRLAPGRFLAGCGEEVHREAEDWFAETGADYMAVRMRFPGGPSHEATLEAIERFGDDVIGSAGITLACGRHE